MKKLLLLLFVFVFGCGRIFSQANIWGSPDKNTKCYFSLSREGFVSEQGYDGYVVYEIPGMNSSELKGSVFTVLSSMYQSPKDVITSISDLL